MTTNITVKTKIRVNGREYGSVDEMPADVRPAYERALASMSAKPADQLRSGSPQSKLIFNGHEYTSVAEMPAAVRQLYAGVMATVDANGNGIPDVLETSAPGTSGPLPTPTSMAAASVTGGIVRPDPTRAWLVVAGVVVAALLLAAFVLGW